jgi:hypothetical protein
MTDEDSTEYAFNDKEIRSLVRLLRKNESVLDPELDGFLSFLENHIYHSMTIEEAEAFFDEKR